MPNNCARQIKLEIPVGSVSLGPKMKLFKIKSRTVYTKAFFQGVVEVEIGCDHPRFEYIINHQGVTIEENRTILSDVRLSLRHKVEYFLPEFLNAIAFGIIRSSRTGNIDIERIMVDAFSLTIGCGLKMEGIEGWIAPEPSLILFPPNLSLDVVHVDGEIVKLELGAINIHGFPVKAYLAGHIIFEIGLTLVGWQDIAKLILRYVGSETAAGAAIAEALGAREAVMEALKPLLARVGIPVGTVALTLVATAAVTYFSMYVLHQAHREGEQGALASQYAAGYIREIWGDPAGNVANSFRQIHNRGIEAAQRDIRQYSRPVVKEFFSRRYSLGRQPEMGFLILRFAKELCEYGRVPVVNDNLRY